MAKVIFDWPNKLIVINTWITDIDVKVDIYSDWKEWFIISDNSKYLPAIRAVWWDPLPWSKALWITYFLMNWWKIRPYEWNHTLNINGNLYTESWDSPYVSTLWNYNVMLISSVSSLVEIVTSNWWSWWWWATPEEIWNYETRELTRYQTVAWGNIVKDNSDKLISTVKDLEKTIKDINKNESKKESNKELEVITTKLNDLMVNISTINNNINTKDLQDIKDSVDKMNKDYWSISKEINKINIPEIDYSFISWIEEQIKSINLKFNTEINTFKWAIENDLSNIVQTIANINNNDLKAELNTNKKEIDKLTSMLQIVLDTIKKDKQEKAESRQKELNDIKQVVREIEIQYED